MMRMQQQRFSFFVQNGSCNHDASKFLALHLLNLPTTSIVGHFLSEMAATTIMLPNSWHCLSCTSLQPPLPDLFLSRHVTGGEGTTENVEEDTVREGEQEAANQVSWGRLFHFSQFLTFFL